MTRHSFIQMSNLSNVKGRISYITSPARQENLYATYHTADAAFWTSLARENQQEFKRSGTEGTCIEAREFIIALPEKFTRYDPQRVLTKFTEEFQKRYNVECVSGLHHNKAKTNYHIHLIFSERRLLPEPVVKVATRNMFYDEVGKHVRTKKEITGEDGQIRPGCTVIKKGEVYESHMFSVKDARFKQEGFVAEVKEFYTGLINRYISDPEQQLKVFDPQSVYLPTKKIGRNNPKAEEIKADNAARQEWNRTADMALLTGISEAEILEVKQAEIHEKVRQSIHQAGWLPHLFRAIVGKARAFLQGLIRQRAMPPKPTLDIDMLVKRNDALTLADIDALKPQKIVISPGPCTPDEAGISLDVIRHYAGRLPILGVCLGHQAMAQAFGGKVVRAAKVMHGKTSPITHNGEGVFRGLANPLTVTRYHSLVVEPGSLPACFDVTAWSETREIMGIRHRQWDLEGVQFHPESILSEQGHQLLANFLHR